MTENLVCDRLRGFRADLAAAAWTKRFRDARPQQLQIVVDLCHCTDGRTRCLDGVGLLDRNCGRNAADVVHTRLVHAVEELPHVRTECLDVTPLAFGINCLEGER